MQRPRIQHIAINVKAENRNALAEYYRRVFGMEQKLTSEIGTVYLSDGFVDVALISTERLPLGINHFGFKVENVEAVLEAAGTKAESNVYGAVAESWIFDPEGNRVDVDEHGWPV